MDTVHLSFSGGEARGYAHIGCLQAVEQLGFRVTEVSGSSIGAWVAALVAAGSSAAELLHLGTTLRRRDFLRYAWPEARTLVNVFRPPARRKPAGLWSLDPYARTLNRLLHRARFEDLRLPCFIQATDLTNFRPLVFSRDLDPFMDVAFAVTASSAYPGLIAPLEWGGRLLADGGAFVDLRALPIRARRIIVSNVSGHGYARDPLTSLPRVVGAYLRYRERALMPPARVGRAAVTVITYPPSLGRLKPFRRPKPEVARQIIAEACGTALAVLSGEGPSHA